MHIYLDESGDLGFGKRSSRWFLIAMAIVRDERTLERIMKKFWRSFRKKHKHAGELHAAHEKDDNRLRILRMLSRSDELMIMSISLDKRSIVLPSSQEKSDIYNKMAESLFEELQHKLDIGPEDSVCLVADKRENKIKIQDEFITLLCRVSRSRRLSIKIEKSHENKSLQAVDFIAWAIFQKLEHGKLNFYKIIADKTVGQIFFTGMKKKAPPL